MPLISKKNALREKRILNNLNLDRLPFKVKPENFCDFLTNIIRDYKSIFSVKGRSAATTWCLSSMKKFKIFLIIFEANELGKEIYKEQIATKLPEYSYKTIASIIDEGIKKEYFVRLLPRISQVRDLKISNIRPSEQLTAEFINWSIEAIVMLNNSVNNNYKH